MKRSALIVRLSAIAAAFLAFLAPAVSHAGTEPTGPLTAARSGPVLVALPDGHALVAGGYVPNTATALATAELFDPLTSTFAATSSMGNGRANAAVALLADGRVLVVGGNGSPTSAEIYNPATASWTPTGTISRSRTNAKAFTLPNGKVLIVGGDNSSRAVDLYDPATGLFTPTGSMISPRNRYAAVLLSDGRVLALGGYPTTFTVMATAEIWDPSTGLWSATGSMANARMSATATLLANGLVLVAGGQATTSFSTAVSPAELYDPVNGTFTVTGSLATARVGHVAAATPDGYVYIAGGTSSSAFPTASIERYNPATGTWSNASAMSMTRNGHNAVTLANGDVLIAGGSAAAESTSAELIDPVCVGAPAAISPASAGFLFDGGTGTVSVTQLPGCSWRVKTIPAWVTLTSPAHGAGNGTVSYTVAAQTASTSRSATLSIADNSFSITQAGNTCAAATLSPAALQVPLGGQSGSINLTASATCNWTVTGVPSWMTITPVSSGSGNRTFGYTVASSPGDTRSATVTIAGKTLTVTQQDWCVPVPSLSPSSLSVIAAQSTSTVAVTAPAACAWSVTGKPAWITMTTAGSGNATLSVTASSNVGAERTSTFSVANTSFTVTQAANPCLNPTLAPASVSVDGNAGTGSVSLGGVLTSCNWTVTGVPSWVTITSGTSGTGPAAIAYSYAANAGAARSATITIAGAAFTINQAVSPCSTASLSPTSLSIPIAGASGSVSLSAGATCGWTVTGVPPWMTLPAAGTGPGPLSYTVEPNTGTPRSATVTIAGRTLTVSQAGDPCLPVPTISPSSLTFGSAAGTSAVVLTAPAACAWSVTGKPAWITMSTSGSGNATLNVSAAANTGAERTATFSVANTSFTVTQAASPCLNPTLAPASVSVDGNAGTGSVSLGGVSASCSWTVTGVPSWVTITSGTSGTGPAAIAYSYAANAGAARSATITIAGAAFAINQAVSPCSTASLSPAALSLPVAGASGSVTLSAGATCEWTPTGVPSWMTLPAAGTGPGSLGYTVEPNPGSPRSATITIAGRTWYVAQAGDPCLPAPTISPSSLTFGSAGGASPVAVTAPAGCPWSVIGKPAWITMVTSWTGSATLSVSATANTGTERTATFTVAGNALTVTQAADACMDAVVDPTSVSAGTAAGSGTLSLSVSSSCSWAVTGVPSWITITSETSGTGNAAIAYSYAENTGAVRSATLTIAGVPFTVSQAGAVPPTYCASRGLVSRYEWIRFVQVAGVSRLTDNDGGYGDFTGTAAIPLARGANAIYLDPGFESGASSNEQWSVWIDFNSDGVFSDSERVFTGGGLGAGVGSFSVDSSLPANTTRMRISMQHSTPASSCETFFFGEVEDYTVTY